MQTCRNASPTSLVHPGAILQQDRDLADSRRRLAPCSSGLLRPHPLHPLTGRTVNPPRPVACRTWRQQSETAPSPADRETLPVSSSSTRSWPVSRHWLAESPRPRAPYTNLPAAVAARFASWAPVPFQSFNPQFQLAALVRYP